MFYVVSTNGEVHNLYVFNSLEEFNLHNPFVKFVENPSYPLIRLCHHFQAKGVESFDIINGYNKRYYCGDGINWILVHI